MNNQEIETRKNCTECGKEFLRSNLCNKCKQERNLLTEHNLLQVTDMVKLISIKDIKDGDVIILEFDSKLNNIAQSKLFMEATEEIPKKILEITQKNIVFIVLEKGMKIEHIPEAKLNSIGLAKVKKNNGKDASIW